MNLKFEFHPDYGSPIKTNELIQYKLIITDPNLGYIHYQNSGTSTLDKLNDLLSNLDDTKSSYLEVDFSMTYYDSKKNVFSFMHISNQSDLLNIFNKKVKNGQVNSSVGEIKTNNYESYGEKFVIYLLTEETVKGIIDWGNSLYDINADDLKNEITSLTTQLELNKQVLEQKKKLSAELIYIQKDLSKAENELGKIDVNALSNLYVGYTSLAKSTMTPDVKEKYNAIMNIQKNWNILADKLGLPLIK